MSPKVLEVGAACFASALRDEPWQDFGFSRRPKYGAWVQRFRKPWKVAAEKAVLREMVALFTTAYILAGQVERSDLDDFVRLYSDGFGSSQELWRTFDYPSRAGAVQDWQNAIALYLDASPSTWGHLLLDRIPYADIPDTARQSRLILGAIQFAVNVQGMVSAIKKQHAGG